MLSKAGKVQISLITAPTVTNIHMTILVSFICSVSCIAAKHLLGKITPHHHLPLSGSYIY